MPRTVSRRARWLHQGMRRQHHVPEAVQRQLRELRRALPVPDNAMPVNDHRVMRDIGRREGGGTAAA